MKRWTFSWLSSSVVPKLGFSPKQYDTHSLWPCKLCVIKQTDRCQRGGGTGWKVRGWAKKHICVHIDTGDSEVTARGRWGWGLGGDGQSRGNGDICDSVNNKNKFKK